MTVTKGIIPAGGLGTRLRPVTEILPKELLPVITKPSIYFVLEEAIASGLREIILIVSEEKKKFLLQLESVFPNLTFHFVVQKEPLGLGHAVGLAQPLVGEDPFAVLLPDILIDAQKPATLQLMEIFKTRNLAVGATQRTLKDKLHLYGVYDIEKSDGKLHKAKGVVEKPPTGEAPSDLMVMGRYLFTPELFAIQKNTPPGHANEIQLADAMDRLAQKGALFALEIDGIHFDLGTPQEYLRTLYYFGKKEYGTDFYQGLG